ncbi:hypothetical protein GCM10011403_11630 [Pseudohongiella nitratireducens]|uniref:YqjK-like protein n=1 Tax=Pseudohongiella nitratireducens TaxID=1768907 RepID=A0A917GTR1_9GAMM|nr:hypothetical protein [Pseudohongiella nitratireducens]MDF1622463.1 hypothetical protein [Pseudohongiella nitratireducens]GGG56169.1 hypothetical protein GCM10011403_11630 [Pseudohongiella nitratireducens]
MNRNDQIRRIERLEVELSARLTQASVTSRRPLAIIMKHKQWLFPGAGLAFGVMLARIPFRNVVTRSISATLLAMRVRRIASRALQRM